MVSKCANPDCCTPFLHFREGALFLFEANYNSEPPMGIEDMSVVRKQPQRLENFWLCDNCSSRFMVRMIRGKTEVVPREDKAGPLSSTGTRAGWILSEQPRIL